MMRFQTATSLHAQELANLVNSAYRGEYSEQGWTTEASLLGGQRTDSKKLEEMMATPLNQIEIAINDESQKIIGSVHLIQELPDTLYFGMLTVEPKLQNLGLGKKMLEHLENIARGYEFKRIRFTVIPTRGELIAFYERQGYKASGKFEPFPENAQGYYFSNGVIGQLSSDYSINLFVSGEIIGNLARIKSIKVPELIVINEEDRILENLSIDPVIMND